jgi:phosphopantothenoylcysteine decarboxylase/phosphopantothenate--cysteine ligase
MTGIGRMVEVQELVGVIRMALGQSGPLHGRKVVVTAGGTQEPIDPVRAITNRSSGKQGYAIAQAALDLGAEVTLITASTHLEAPVGVQKVDVRTAQDMLEAVLAAIPRSDVLVMAAAVADFRPAHPAGKKIKKEGGIPDIQLENTPDILKEVAAFKTQHGCPHVVVGFAAESEHLLENAAAKLRRKSLDVIIANDIAAKDAGFAVDNNRVTLLDSGGEVESLPLMTKAEVADVVVQRVVKKLGLNA